MFFVGFSERDEIWQGALLRITTQIDELWSERFSGRQNSEGVKNCNAFLVHRLAERDERHWCV